MKFRGGDAPRIERVDVNAYTIPTESPESDGTLEWNATTVVVVEIQGGGIGGIGFSYGHHAAALLIRDSLAAVVRGRPAFDVPAIWNDMVRAVRNIGRPGLASMAIAAVDIALHDLRARLLAVPLATLLGRARVEVPVYASAGFTSWPIPKLQQEVRRCAEQGIHRFKMKVGRRPDDDVQRVKAAREALGAEGELYVDANGAYSRQQALRLGRKFSEFGVSWFEEPVSSDDLRGLRWLRDRLPGGVELAAGEYGSDLHDFRRLLETDAVDVLMPDATRCAGITGFMEVGALCAAFGVPLSAHTAPTVHLHPCCALRTVRSMEWFHDHARIERMLFDGALQPVDGVLRPDLARPGLGIELRRRDASRFAA